MSYRVTSDLLKMNYILNYTIYFNEIISIDAKWLEMVIAFC